ncbi:MAG: HAD family phosphatase [Planctomycetes bacterium]|nr:HAD family phosphatase [Planctomycetota bacterium]
MIQAVIFDFDGTITKPYLNFRNIKKDLGMPEDEIYLLEKMYELPEPEKTRAFGILARHEAEAVANSELNEGVHELLDFLAKRNIKAALLTRNSAKSMKESCQKHGICFDLIVTREDASAKPKPDGILLASRKMKIGLDKIIMVGDYLFDIMAGKNAGVKTVLITNGHKYDWEVKSDFTIKSLIELKDLIETGLI